MSKFSKFAAIAAVTGLMASCTSNAPMEEDGGILTKNQTVYVKVAVRGENGFGTKAGASDDGNPTTGDMAAGTGKESEINKIYFVFYDKEGNMVGDVVDVPLEGEKDATGEVETLYENTVAVSLLKGEDKPTQVMCYINPVSLNDVQQPLSVIQTITRDLVEATATGFPMSNSVYYSGEAPQVAVEISGKVYDTEKKAQEATSAVEIYVERRAARLNFSIDPSILNTTTNGAATDVTVKKIYESAENGENIPAYDLTFHIEGWDVNAQTRNTYMVKSFREENPKTGEILADNYTYTALNKIINKANGDWTWNSETYHRSYWAISPAYFVNKYPEVASDVDTQNTNLIYIKPDGYAWNTTYDGTSHYYREATIGSAALNSSNPAAGVASIVLKGYYTINNQTLDFYTYQKTADNKAYVFLKDKPAGTSGISTKGMTMKERFIQLQGVLYKLEDGKYQKITMEDVNGKFANNIDVIHPTDATLAADASVQNSQPMKVASRQRTLQVKEAPITTTLYYASGNGYSPVTSENLREVNRALIHQLNFASFYDQGQAYFNIPIKHFGWWRKSNTQKDESKIDWGKVRVGDFGMVRNHAYDVYVESIKGLGIGIGTPTDPIIPPAETDDVYVKYEVKCLKWAIVPTQKENL